MIRYKHEYKKRHRFWSLIVGWVVFLIAMGITFADLHGSAL